MGTYLIETKRGKFEVELDDPSELPSIIAQIEGEGGEKEARSGFDILPEIGLSGVTGRLSDYVGAAGRVTGDRILGAFGVGDSGNLSFNDALRDVGGDRAAYQEKNPITGHGTELAGAVTSPLYRGAAKLAGSAVRGVGTLSRYGRYGAQGAGVGAAAGAGYSRGEDGGIPSSTELLQDTALGAGLGGGLGIGFGALTEGVLKGGGLLFNWVRDRAISRLPPKAGEQTAKGANHVAKKVISTNMRRDVSNLNRADARLKQMGDDGTVADVGPNLTALAKQTVQTPNPGMAITKGRIGARAKQAETKMVEAARAGAKGKYEVLSEQLIQRRQKEAGPLFRQAFRANQNVESKAIDRLLERPSARKAMRDAVRMMQEDGAGVSRVDSELTAALRELEARLGVKSQSIGGVGRGLKLRTLDYVRQALWLQEKALKKQAAAGNAKDSAWRAVGNTRRLLTSLLKKNDVTRSAGPNSFKAEGGLYEKALLKYQEPSRAKSALELGRSWASKKKADEIKLAHRRMTQEERDYFIAGMADDIETRLTENPTAALNFLRKTASKNKMRAAFNNSREYNEFRKVIEQQKIFADNNRKILSGSDTKLNQAVAEDIGGQMGEIGESAVSVAAGRPIAGAPGEFIARIVRRFSTHPDEVMRELAKMLTSRDPAVKAEVMRAMRAIERHERIKANQLLRRASTASTLPAQVGAVTQ